jgi:hypothetical protein
MKPLNKQNLRVFILMLETLLLFVASILGNKISELLQIPDASLLIATTVVLLAIVFVLIYFREGGANVGHSFRWRFRLTQKKVGNFIFWLWYSSCVLFLAPGAVTFTNHMDESWTAWLLNVAVIGILLSAPIDLRATVEHGYRRWPVAIYVLLAALYSVIGFVLWVSPTLIESNLLLFTVIWSALVTVIQFTVLTHLMETSFIPWIKTLPEK